jgi:hypothetical protein
VLRISDQDYKKKKLHHPPPPVLSTVQAYCKVAGCFALAIKDCIAITGFGLRPSDSFWEPGKNISSYTR